jgi:hypothetical protein
MSKLVSLRGFRSKRRQAYLARYGARIDRIIEIFVDSHIDVTFREMQSLYMAGELSPAPEAWDYVHFREILAEVIDKVFGKLLYEQLNAQYWFDTGMISQDEVVERALRSYITEQCGEYAITGD